jgi:hypothetical protein
MLAWPKVFFSTLNGAVEGCGTSVLNTFRFCGRILV